MADDHYALLANLEVSPDAYWSAIARFDPLNPLPLARLLGSDDPATSRRGLRIFGDIGRKAFVVLDEALALSGHPDEMARNALMDGVICYSENLSARQASAVLTLVNDTLPLVREKVVVFLTYANLASLESAIDNLDEPLKSEHQIGFETLATEPTDAQQLFDQAVDRNDIWAMYAFAAINRRARKAQLQPVPVYAGDDFVPSGVIQHVNMLNARREHAQRRSLRGEERC